MRMRKYVNILYFCRNQKGLSTLDSDSTCNIAVTSRSSCLGATSSVGPSVVICTVACFWAEISDLLSSIDSLVPMNY